MRLSPVPSNATLLPSAAKRQPCSLGDGLEKMRPPTRGAASRPRRYCDPLTVTDHASRFLLPCEALDSTCRAPACTASVRLFGERGLPLASRSGGQFGFATRVNLWNRLEKTGQQGRPVITAETDDNW
jgi:hypothetical protein